MVFYFILGTYIAQVSLLVLYIKYQLFCFRYRRYIWRHYRHYHYYLKHSMNTPNLLNDIVHHASLAVKFHNESVEAARRSLDHKRELGRLVLEYKNNWMATKGISTDTWKKHECPRLCKYLSETIGKGKTLLSVTSMYRYERLFKYWDTIVERGWTGLSCSQIDKNLSALMNGHHIQDDYISEAETDNKLRKSKNVKTNQLVEAVMQQYDDLRADYDTLLAEKNEMAAKIAELQADLVLKDSLLRQNGLPVPVRNT